MSCALTKETQGAWIIHHGRKVVMDAHGPAEFPAIDEASKAANLLSRLGETQDVSLSMPEVQAIARAARLNPRYELTGLLETLQQKRLIEVNSNGINVLGVTTRGALGHAADFFRDADPSKAELASLELAEQASKAPVLKRDMSAFIGDSFKMDASGNPLAPSVPA